MAAHFDPYHKWLGISPKDQPPNHYRLLGIELFEGDPDVIDSAADQRMAHVRTFQAGQNSADSQRLLNELSAARICLLDALKKTPYDDALRCKLQQASAPTVGTAPTVAASMSQTTPLAASATPIIVSSGGSGGASRRLPRQRPVWQKPAVLGAAALALVVVVLVLATRTPKTSSKPDLPESRSDLPTASSTPANRPNASPRAATTKPGASDAAIENAMPTPSPPAGPNDVPIQFSLVADAGRRPQTPGVVADRVVIWNQHNDGAKDRGTRECNLSLWRDGREVWRQDAIETPWSPDVDKSVSVTLPQERFDRVRVEVTNWERAGGGLAEIEVISGERNLALGCPAVASAWYDDRFPPNRLTDGISASSRDAFWLLPDGLLGWAEVDLALAEPRPCPGLLADKLVVWNTHNSHRNDRGALALNVRLSLGSDEVWRQDDVAIPWKPDWDGEIEIALPDKRFDRVRIEIPRWQGPGGGLSEVQVIRGGVDVARACPVVASGFFDTAFVPSNVVDGVTSSVADRVGYWVGIDGQTSWVEIDLSCNCPEVGEANRERGQYLALVENDWLRGLPWLARGDAIELRALAAADSRLEARVTLDASQASDALSVGDRWWELAQRSSEPAKQALLTRALYRYAAAVEFAPESDRARLDERRAQCLPLRDGAWLYLLRESDTAHLWPDNNVRRAAIFAGVRRPWSLWMTPMSDESAGTTFHLAKKYRRLAGAAAISDTSRGFAATPLIFKILGDERELWVSRPLQDMGAFEPFDVDVSGVDQLRLVVECRGHHGSCHAMWLAPVLDPSSATPAIAARPVASDGAVDLLAKPPDPPEGVVNLLTKVDVANDRVDGDWKREDSALISPRQQGARLQLPIRPSDNYEVTIVAERLAGVESFIVGLVVGGRQVAMTLDGYGGETAGLANLDGRDGASNEATRHGRRLPPGKPHTIVCTVRGNGLRVTCDGKEALNWSGDASRLSSNPFLQMPDQQRLYLAAWESKFRYTRIEYRPLTDEPRKTLDRPRPGGLAVLSDQSRLAIPNDDALKPARTELQKQFSAKLAAARSPDAKRALAEELIQKAAATTAPSAAVYVTLNQAVDLAEAAGDLDLAWQAINDLADAFDVNPLPRRQQSLIAVGKAASSPGQYRDLADAACLLTAEALAAEDAALVKKAAALGQSFAKRGKDAALVKLVAARAKDATKLAGQIDGVSRARDTLKTSPDDTSANFIVGHYELGAGGDREHALRKLAKAADADWKKLAGDDLNASRDEVSTQQQLALADAWLARSKNESWPGRHYLRMRAAEWYHRASPALKGPERTRCVDRLKALLADDDGLPNWELFELNRVEKRGTYLRIEPGGSLRTRVEFDGPMDITVVARTDSLNIRLCAHGTESVIWNWEVNPSELRVRGHDGSTVPFPVTRLQPDRWYTLRYQVTQRGTNITVDGLPVFSDNKGYQAFPRSAVGVNGAGPAVIDVKKFIVRPVE